MGHAHAGARAHAPASLNTSTPESPGTTCSVCCSTTGGLRASGCRARWRRRTDRAAADRGRSGARQPAAAGQRLRGHEVPGVAARRRSEWLALQYLGHSDVPPGQRKDSPPRVRKAPALHSLPTVFDAAQPRVADRHGHEHRHGAGPQRRPAAASEPAAGVPGHPRQLRAPPRQLRAPGRSSMSKPPDRR